MRCTRPDFCYVVTLLSQHMSSPTEAHLNLCRDVMRYLKKTHDYCLKFVKSKGGLNLTGYCDADWGSSLGRKSISGYCFMLNDSGALISWRSCKQRSVALSTCEAEYIALTEAVKEAKFLRQLFADMTGNDQQNVVIHDDNQGAIKLAYNPVFHQRSKHIDIRYHFIRDEIQNGIDLVYVPSEKNVADIFTKPLSKFKFDSFPVIRGEGVVF